MVVTVTPVTSTAELDEFIHLPRRLYAGEKNWVVPLVRLEKEALSARSNPFFLHADIQLFLAREGGDVVGRISAQVDHEHNRVHNERTGFFGYFESELDDAVAQPLLQTAESWLQDRGMERARGPLSFSLNGESGLLIDGFDTPPMVMMPFNPPEYSALIEAAGYTKAKDLFAWHYDFREIPQRALKMARAVRDLPEVSTRTLNMSRLEQDMASILEIVNSAWSENWGFVPLTEDEAKQFVNDFKLIADPNLVQIVEIDGSPAAVAVCLPNLNEAIRDLDGKLFPLGFLKLIWRLKIRRVRGVRLILLGVRKEFRIRRYAGLPYLLGDELFIRGSRRGYKHAEFSWTLEDNGLINATIQHMGCERYKTYRVYEKALTS